MRFFLLLLMALLASCDSCEEKPTPNRVVVRPPNMTMRLPPRRPAMPARMVQVRDGG